jgi:tRNA uridine 5-carbamoylmethylation protein Kti12
MRPAIVLILGFPGTGKLTVSRELVASLSAEGVPVRLIDNHATANVLFDLIAEADGKTPLPPEVLENVREMNQIVARTIENLSPRDWSFVFTHHLRDNEQNRSYLERLQAVAKTRRSTFLAVVLTCDHDVLLTRVAEPERRSRNKLIDPAIAETILEGGMLVPDQALAIDITVLPPTGTAKIIRQELTLRSS